MIDYNFIGKFNKVIFLDFDGVLNSVRSVVADNCNKHDALTTKKTMLLNDKIESGFDPVAVNLVYQLIQRTDSYVVVSSAWRHSMSLVNLRNIFNIEFGWPSGIDERIIGTTEIITNNNRGEEIDKWISDHTCGIRNFNYIIIDDGYVFLDNQFKRLVQTDPYEGFLFNDYCKALLLFGIHENYDNYL
jgi:hypothetical protein